MQAMCAMQRFCTHNPENGLPRAKPYNADLTAEDGMDLAVLVLSWVGLNMPGWTYSRKAEALVSFASSIHAFAMSHHKAWFIIVMVLMPGHSCAVSRARMLVTGLLPCLQRVHASSAKIQNLLVLTVVLNGSCVCLQTASVLNGVHNALQHMLHTQVAQKGLPMVR